MKVLVILGKTIFFYVIITVLYRVMGKREVGELKVADLVVSMMLANIVAIGIENYKENILISLVPVMVLVLMQILVAKLTFKYERVRKFVDGEPSVIINRGKINFDEMLRQRYNLDDLLMELRDKGISSIEEVDYAILEVNGRLSVFPNNENSLYPLPLILDGKVEQDTLRQIGKSMEWLEKVIEKEGYSLKEVFYAFYRNNEVFLIKNQNI